MNLFHRDMGHVFPPFVYATSMMRLPFWQWPRNVLLSLDLPYCPRRIHSLFWNNFSFIQRSFLLEWSSITFSVVKWLYVMSYYAVCARGHLHMGSCQFSGFVQSRPKRLEICRQNHNESRLYYETLESIKQVWSNFIWYQSGSNTLQVLQQFLVLLTIGLGPKLVRVLFYQ